MQKKKTLCILTFDGSVGWTALAVEECVTNDEDDNGVGDSDDGDGDGDAW